MNISVGVVDLTRMRAEGGDPEAQFQFADRVTLNGAS